MDTGYIITPPGGAGSLNSECGPWRPEPREVQGRTFRRGRCN